MANLADRFVRFLAASKEGRIVRLAKLPPMDMRNSRDMPRDTYTSCPVRIDPVPVFWFPADIHTGSILELRSKFTPEDAQQMRNEVGDLAANGNLVLPYPECFIGWVPTVTWPLAFDNDVRYVQIARCRQTEDGTISVEEFHDQWDYSRYTTTRIVYNNLIYQIVGGDTVRWLHLYEVSDEVLEFEQQNMHDVAFTVLHALCLLSRQREITMSEIDPPTNRYLARNSARGGLKRMVEIDLSAFQYRMQYDPKEHPTGREQAPHDRRAHIRHHKDGRISNVRAAKIKGGNENLRHYAVKRQQDNLRPS